MTSVSLVEQLSAMDAADQTLATSIFGFADPQQIADLVAQMVWLHCNQNIDCCEFWELSVSFTTGLRLTDGRRLVLKCRSPQNISLEALLAICQVQQALADQGFPCPAVLMPPVQFGHCWMTVEQLLDVGENCDAHDPTSASSDGNRTGAADATGPDIARAFLTHAFLTHQSLSRRAALGKAAQRPI